MSDPVAAFLAARAFGVIERRVPLRGKLQLPDGSESVASLVLTPSGLFVVAARDAEHGATLELDGRQDVQVEFGRVQTALRVGEHQFTVLAPRASSLGQAIALGRLRQAGRPLVHRPFPDGRHIDSPTELERTWLDRWLGDDELLLAWLRTNSHLALPSPISEGQSGELRMALTDRRLAIAAVSDIGDVFVEVLRPRTLTVTSSKGRASVTAGTRVLEVPRSAAERFAESAGAAALSGNDRVLEVARLSWIGHDAHHLPFCRALVARASERGHPLAPILELALGVELGEDARAKVDLLDPLSRLRAAGAPAAALAELYSNWQLSPGAGHALLDRLRGCGEAAEPWALELHGHLHDVAPNSTPDPARKALATIALAEHSIAADEPSRAIELLEHRLDELPSEALSDVTTPGDVDLTTGGGVRTLRGRVFELIAHARGEPDLRAVAELARLQPLVLERVRDLVEVAGGELRARAERVVQLLEPGGLAYSTSLPTESGRVRSLSDKLVNGLVRHPSAREGSPVLGRIQSLLANVPVPDLGMLRDYCEKLSDGRYPDASRALFDACVALGYPGVEAYISQGVKGVGLRAYEASPPFVLIGGQHLGDGDFRLSAAELRFALGAEVAHLRLGHSRVTSTEFWAGTIEVGRQGLDLALTMLPFLRGWELADKAMRATSRMRLPVVRSVVGAAQGLRDRVSGPASVRTQVRENGDVLSLLNEQLVFAHRAMQLTADRAGLVLCNDPRAAVRAMMLVRRDYGAELRLAEERGLVRMLGRRTEDGHMAYQDLAIRVASLLSFYLSDEYTRLRAALFG